MSKKKTAIISATVTLLLAGGIVATILIINNQQDQPFRLDSEYYAASEAIDITRDQYEELVAQKKSFIVMVDKPDCVTTTSMREFMSNFPSDTQFKYYRMMWEEVSKSSLHEKVKFAPSIAIIREGVIKAWLDADSDKDVEYYNSAEALQSWIKKYILF
jgi:hypothetical protein